MPPLAGYGAPNTNVPVTPNRVDTTTQPAFVKRKKKLQLGAMQARMKG